MRLDPLHFFMTFFILLLIIHATSQQQELHKINHMPSSTEYTYNSITIIIHLLVKQTFQLFTLFLNPILQSTLCLRTLFSISLFTTSQTLYLPVSRHSRKRTRTLLRIKNWNIFCSRSLGSGHLSSLYSLFFSFEFYIFKQETKIHFLLIYINKELLLL